MVGVAGSERRQALDQAVIDYIASVPPEFRPLFDRTQRLIVEACPDAAVVLPYKMPTYKLGNRRLHLAVWQHGVSVYGWKNLATVASPPVDPTSRPVPGRSGCAPRMPRT